MRPMQTSVDAFGYNDILAGPCFGHPSGICVISSHSRKSTEFQGTFADASLKCRVAYSRYCRSFTKMMHATKDMSHFNNNFQKVCMIAIDSQTQPGGIRNGIQSCRSGLGSNMSSIHNFHRKNNILGMLRASSGNSQVALLASILSLEAGIRIIVDFASRYLCLKVMLIQMLPVLISWQAFQCSFKQNELQTLLTGGGNPPVPKLGIFKATMELALPLQSSVRHVCQYSSQVVMQSAALVERVAKESFTRRFTMKPGWILDLFQTYGSSTLILTGLSCWVQGFRCFPWMAMNYYFKDQLDVNPALLQFLQNTMNLPFLAKPIYGIISDTIYIGGAHRLPYFTLAGLFQLASWGMIIMHGGAKSSVAVLAAVLTLSNLGAALSEVVNDALIAESGKRKGAMTGELQSFAWLATAVGGLVGNLFGGLALRKLGFEVICSIFAAFVALHLLISSTISEGSLGLQPKRLIVYKELSNIASGNAAGRWWENIHMQQVQQQTCVLFQLLKKPKFYQPILWFMGSSAIVPTITSSMFYYQSQHLGINAFYLGLAKMIGQVGLLAGSVTYNRYFKSVSLQKVTQFLQILLSICIASDILLVNRLNLCLGIPDHLYIFGASAFVEAVAQFKGLPFAVFLAKSCPQGSEGSLLALFMACQCLASIVSGYFGVALAFSLHISASNFANLPFGIFVQSMAALLPLLWLTWLPDEDTVNKIN